MLVSRQGVAEYLDRELDDFRWLKRASRDRIMRELAAIGVRPRFKREPWLHQLVCFYIAQFYPRFLFLLDMGAGKTQIISDVYEQKRREGKVDRGLVAVPRIINMDTWARDLAKSSDLEPTLVDCEGIEDKWDCILRARGDLTIVDTQGLVLALTKKVKKKGKAELVRDDRKIAQLLERYNFLDVDEIHKNSNRNSTWYDVVERISRGCDFAYGNTGTAFGKDVQTLHAVFCMIDGGETLGETLGPFRAAFFEAKTHPWKGVTYSFRKSEWDALHRMIQHRSIRYEEEEMHDLPKKVSREVAVSMGDEQREHYLNALEGLINSGGDFRALEGAYTRMRQIVSGYLAWNDDAGNHVLRFRKNPKLDALEDLVDSMGDSKVIIVYWYTETGRMVTERLREMGVEHEWLWGGTKDRAGLMRRIMDPGGPRALVMQAEAGGTGTDGLQEVARYVVMYETPSDPTTRRQTEKRVGRPGQKHRWYVYDLVARGSCDRGILEGIAEGIDTHAAVVNGKRRGRGFFLAD